MGSARYWQSRHLRANDCFINNQLRRDVFHGKRFSDMIRFDQGSKSGADSRIRTDTGSPLQRISPHRYPSPACLPLPPYPREVKTERVGFEPTDLSGPPDLKSGAINHSATFPKMVVAGRTTGGIFSENIPRGPLFPGCRTSPQPGMLLTSLPHKTVQALSASNLTGLFQITQFVADS